MMKNLLEWVRKLWPERPEQSAEDATQEALRVYPRCC